MDAQIAALVEAALVEDIGQEFQDITTAAVVGDEPATAEIIANEPGVAAGLSVAQAVFRRLEPECVWDELIVDGGDFEAGQSVAAISGRLRTILTGERTALNILAHLSGVASLTKQFVSACSETQARVFDTRKTIPGLRSLEKAAVRAGGGHNHRFGLYDGILIKDNHLVGCDIRRAVNRARAAYPDKVVEVEVETLDQLRVALEAKADIVLLDNMDLDTLKEAVCIAKGKVEIEVSGGVNIETIGAIANAGAERISVGVLTQGAPPIDFSLNVIKVG